LLREAGRRLALIGGRHLTERLMDALSILLVFQLYMALVWTK
jgi:hypothetical protein